MNRTPRQNRSIHKYCELLADALNDAGYSFNDGRVIQLPVRFTKENVNGTMWRNVQLAMYPEKASTTELETPEVGDVYKNLDLYLAENFGVSVPFPSEESKNDPPR